MDIFDGVKLNIDWAYFRKSTVALSVACVISISLALGSYSFVEGKRGINTGSQVQLTQMKAKYQDAVKQLQLVDQYYDGYKKLEQQGFIGDENRLNWVETLRGITEKRKVATIDYNIKALAPYAPKYPLRSSLFQINSSEMVLQMKLLHEHDLLDIFAELNRRTAGVYDIKKCDLSMADKKIVYEASAVNITAQCTLNWFTLQPIGKS